MIGTVTDEQRTPIRHVMFDADGVLQDCPGGWVAAAEPHFGARAMEFLQHSYETQLPTLAGDGDHLELLAALLTEYGVTAPAADVFRDVWLRIEPAVATLALAAALRERGYGVHLGTNQERYRAAHMREVLGYDALFDVSCYSWELGAAKPDPAFFAAAARRIGAAPAAILFIDDTEPNVTAARAAGLAAEQWCLDDGHDALLGLLARHGVASGPAALAGPATQHTGRTGAPPGRGTPGRSCPAGARA
jgi:putative hydrolase of the HAD superfamily